MTETEISAAVDRLLRARREKVRIAPPAISSPEAAYAIQVEIAQREGGLLAWKVAAFGPGRELIFAPILKDTIVESGVKYPSGAFNMIGIEGEVVFKLAKLVAALDSPAPRGQIFELIDEAYAAIEVVDSRLLDGLESAELARIADNMSSGGLVIGTRLREWRSMDLEAPGFVVEINGQRASSSERYGLGDIESVLDRFFAHCRSMGIDLPAGALISAGSCTGLVFASENDEVALMRNGQRLVCANF